MLKKFTKSILSLIFLGSLLLASPAQAADRFTTNGSITATAQTIQATVAEYSNVLFSISGTYVGVNAIFEVSNDNGTNWSTLPVVRIDSSGIETTTGALTSTARLWEASVNGQTYVRVRSTAYTSGTATIKITAMKETTEPIVAISALLPGTGATALGKAEDALHASGDTGVMALGVKNDTVQQFSATEGDYIPIALNSAGSVYVDIDILHSETAIGDSFIRREDSVDAGSDVGVPTLYQTQDPLTVDQNTNGDFANPKVDRAGRTITALSPAGEMFQSCGTATAVTSDVAIKALVASNRMYVTSIDCKNTSTTVGPTLDFKDGAAIVAVGGIPATAAAGTLTGEYHVSYPVPLRGTSGTAFNFATNTAVSSVTCCAHGYISTN